MEFSNPFQFTPFGSADSIYRSVMRQKFCFFSFFKFKNYIFEIKQANFELDDECWFKLHMIRASKVIIKHNKGISIITQNGIKTHTLEGARNAEFSFCFIFVIFTLFLFLFSLLCRTFHVFLQICCILHLYTFTNAIFFYQLYLSKYLYILFFMYYVNERM